MKGHEVAPVQRWQIKCLQEQVVNAKGRSSPWGRIGNGEGCGKLERVRVLALSKGLKNSLPVLFLFSFLLLTVWVKQNSLKAEILSHTASL
jgi:hypothetical protein